MLVMLPTSWQHLLHMADILIHRHFNWHHAAEAEFVVLTAPKCLTCVAEARTAQCTAMSTMLMCLTAVLAESSNKAALEKLGFLCQSLIPNKKNITALSVLCCSTCRRVAGRRFESCRPA